MTTAEHLLTFIKQSTSPYHTVSSAANILEENGFKELALNEEWHLSEGNYYVKVYGTTLFAFHIGRRVRSSMRIASAHTDFPAIRVKPNPISKEKGYGKLNVETYGGLILNTWLDRPLSMAGAVVCRGASPFSPVQYLIDLKRPLFTIPNLAIHMNRAMNDGVALNRQKDMLPLAMMCGDETPTEKQWMEVLGNEIGCAPEDILSYELTLYPAEDGCIFGLQNEFISSPRLDNLTSCVACLTGITEAAQTKAEGLRVIALFDNEEVGSRTKQGGASMILPTIIHRIYDALGLSAEACRADISGGFMVSADVAHAYHPNHGEKNDITNVPILNGGVVLKIAASQSYAGDAMALATVRDLCETNDIPWQRYVNRSDIPGGSTVGSISSAMLTMRTMDVGIALLAMHSARETMGIQDQAALNSLMKAFLR